MSNLLVEKQAQTPEINDDFFPIVYANRGMRFVASLINALVFLVFFAISGFLSDGNKETIGVWIAVAICVSFAIQIFYMHKYKQTLGKKCCGLMVVDYTTSRSLSTGRYILREVVELIAGQLGLGLINAICAFINKERRTVTDMIFSTIVIKIK